jgi:hypothetical protein
MLQLLDCRSGNTQHFHVQNLGCCLSAVAASLLLLHAFQALAVGRMRSAVRVC